MAENRKREPKLTNQQKLFVLEYLIDLNATQAAIRAGYSPKSAKNIAAQLMRKPQVLALIAELSKDRFEKIEIDGDEILKEVRRIALFDPRKLFHKDGTRKDVHELDDDTAAALASIETQEAKSDKKKPVLLVKVKAWDKNTALGNLMRHKSLFNDKVTVTHKLTLEELVAGSDDDEQD